jgi:hypothetical protein
VLHASAGRRDQAGTRAELRWKLEDTVKLRRLAHGQHAPAASGLRQWLAPYARWNLFNPSILVQHDDVHVAFRAYRDGVRVKPFNAYYACATRTGLRERPQLVDLTALARSYGVEPVADPKLFQYDGRVLATFNTGFNAAKPNDIYLMQLAPTVGAPQRCVLDVRNHTEKNWSFFGGPTGELHAVYSLRPFVRLRLVDGEVGGGGGLRFVRDGAEMGLDVSFVARRKGLSKRNLSLGTQAVWRRDDLVVIAHEKVYFGKYRGYLARPVRIEDPLGSSPRVCLARERIIHDVRSAIPRRGVHNQHAFFVVYVAGMTKIDERLILSYGINDTHYGVAEIEGDFEW